MAINALDEMSNDVWYDDVVHTPPSKRYAILTLRSKESFDPFLVREALACPPQRLPTAYTPNIDPGPAQAGRPHRRDAQDSRVPSTRVLDPGCGRVFAARGKQSLSPLPRSPFEDASMSFKVLELPPFAINHQDPRLYTKFDMRYRYPVTLRSKVLGVHGKLASSAAAFSARRHDLSLTSLCPEAMSSFVCNGQSVVGYSACVSGLAGVLLSIHAHETWQDTRLYDTEPDDDAA
ncbi:hypothetical protein MRS44_004402 [Fusarium solani]|uniref:uncharacterized protein n=1 Tax=Fusarium solani TaxID=169388 RepID=UPI0032C47C1A|nr:hypothetical protein MRS44_004402 [Fusarium solani]